MTPQQPPDDLARLQRWMLSVIAHPGGVTHGMVSENAQREIAATPDELQQIIKRSRNLTSTERLQIYGNAYYARLIECLQQEFPATVSAVGEETFQGFAFEYLQAYPPRSYTLARLGADFPRFLRETRPAREGQDEPTPDWADFLIDLATLERTYAEVFDAPGAERTGPLRADDLNSLSSEQWPAARLLPVGCLRLLELRFPVHRFAASVRHGEKPAVPSPLPTYLLVTRRNYIVCPRAVSRWEFDALQGLCEGQTVGEVVTRVAEAGDLEINDLARRLHDCFRRWAADGLFYKLVAPP